MDNNPLISVIIPVYNVEIYLKRCIESIQNQTYKNLEIILINDGSTDSSRKISEESSVDDPRIKVFHKKNGGLSSARNFGLDNALGEWISFIDSDDYIHSDMIENLYECAIKNQVNISICGFVMVDEEGNSIKTHVPTQQVLKGKELHQYFFEEGKGKEYAWNKLYNNQVLKKIRFPFGKIYEDIFVLPEILDTSGKCAFISWAGYYYTQRDTGISKDMDINRQMNGLEAKKAKMEFMKKYYPELISKAKQEILESCCWLLYKTYEVKGTEFKNNKKKILTVFNKEKKGAEKKGFNIKAAIFLINLSPWLFHKAYSIVIHT